MKKPKYPYESFLEIRSKYEAQCQDSSNRFDTTLITLSVSALWAWMFFLTQKTSDTNTCLLFISRIFLGIAIWTTLISYTLSENSIRKRIESLDLNFKWENSSGKENDIIKLWLRMDWLRYVAIWSIVIGILFLLIFLSHNL